MNRLSVERRARVLAALVEGNSVRATGRMTGTAKGTILKLLADAGAACSSYQDATLRDLSCKGLECDEIWAFCHSKERNVSPEHQGQLGFGDVWTWTAIDSDTKLIPSWFVGRRDADSAAYFMEDLASRLANRVQLTTDGLNLYVNAVEDAFGWNGVDYAMLVKIYGQAPEGQRRYSPPVCLGAEKEWKMGRPVADLISTSYVERQNLTMRMSMRRFTRLTNGFSKKLENLEHAVALHFMQYNFARPHATLTKANRGIHTTPAMAAGVADHVWKIEEIAALIP
jgi:IS1 family transposase